MLRVALLSGLNQAAAPLKLGLKRMHWRLAPAQGRAVHAGRVLCGSNANNQSQTPDVVHDMVHFKTSDNAKARGLTKTDVGCVQTWANPFQHSVWTQEEVESVKKTHRPVKGITDALAYYAVRYARLWFDGLSGYHPDRVTKDIVINRAIFLETVAGVPGMAGGMMRHLSSLRNMKRDHGWIHTLLEEAENERMHLLTFVQMKCPGPFFRAAVVGAQGIFMTGFLAAYIIYPPICHRFVGYLEEEAVHTYTDIIRAIDLDVGGLGAWKSEPAPKIAIDYWHMRPDATIRDLMLVVRADEATHRDVNHTLSDLGPDQVNPFVLSAAATSPETKQTSAPKDASSA